MPCCAGPDLPVLLAIILAICKLDGSPSGQTTSEHWKSRKSQEILQHALSYYEWRGYIIKKCLCFGGLHILQTLESIGERIREQGFCMIDPPEKLVACIEYVSHVHLWICVALSLHPGPEKPCLHLLYTFSLPRAHAQIIASFLSGDFQHGPVPEPCSHSTALPSLPLEELEKGSPCKSCKHLLLIHR